jgi:hydroxyacylglutathione hydrolase
MILKTLVVGMYGTNCYIVASELTKKGFVIDPGAEPQKIVGEVNKMGLSIEWIIITHTHFDHIGAVKALQDATSAKIALHELEGEGVNHSLAKALGIIMSGSMNIKFKPDRLLRDGDIVAVDDLQFTILHTPGHSPGGLSLVGHGMVFSGDTLFNCGVGRTDFPGCSQTQLIESIRNKLLSLPDDTIVFPGHGPQTTIGAERRTNTFIID